MKKIILALFAVSVATPALADHPNIGGPGGELTGVKFDNRGQCQAALMQARNERRQAGHTGGRTSSEYNALVRENRSCAQNSDGTWSVI